MNWRIVSLFVLLIALTAYYYLSNLFFGFVCPSEILLGLPCPGCGLTRAALLMIKGDFDGSMRMNPMLLFIPFYFVLIKRKKKSLADLYLICVIVISFIIFGFRMIYSFGTEPLVFNPNNLTGFFLHSLQN